MSNLRAWERPRAGVERSRWIERFSDCMALLCKGKRPSDTDIINYIDEEKEDLTLQWWAREHAAFEWMQGINMIEAAMCLADEPNSAGHLGRGEGEVIEGQTKLVEDLKLEAP